jgi:hypothetical protein
MRTLLRDLTVFVAILWLFLPQRSWGKETPHIAVPPLMVLGGMGNQDAQLDKIYLEELQRRGIQPWQPVEVRAFLSEQPDGNCHLKDKCHGRLAQEVEASGTLIVTVSPYAREVVLNARVVRQDGTIAAEASQGRLYNPHPGTVPVELVRAEVRTALNEMNLGNGNSSALSLTQSSPSLSSPPPAAWWAFGASAVSLGGLTTVLIATAHDSKALQNRLDVYGRWGENDARAIQLRRRLNVEGTLTAVLVTTTAVGVAAGTLLWLGLPQKWLGLSVAPSSGAGLSVSGKF